MASTGTPSANIPNENCTLYTASGIVIHRIAIHLHSYSCIHSHLSITILFIPCTVGPLKVVGERVAVIRRSFRRPSSAGGGMYISIR